MTAYTTLGWRVWSVFPDCILRAPYAYSTGMWVNTHMIAACDPGADHEPPGDTCTCGVYADVTLEASLGRVRRLPELNALARSLDEGWRPMLDRVRPRFVQGRVELHGRTLLDFSQRKDIPELRAARAVIHDLWIPADSPAWLGRGLAQRYSVPIHSDDPSLYGDINVPRSIRRVGINHAAQGHVDLTHQQFERLLLGLEEFDQDKKREGVRRLFGGERR